MRMISFFLPDLRLSAFGTPELRIAAPEGCSQDAPRCSQDGLLRCQDDIDRIKLPGSARITLPGLRSQDYAARITQPGLRSQDYAARITLPGLRS